MNQDPSTFSSTHPIIVLTRPEDSGLDWQELDRGPGYFTIPAGHEVRVRIKSIDDRDLQDLVQELEGVEMLRFLDLSENRNVSNAGLARLSVLPQLTGLNLSSCSITSTGPEQLRRLPNLTHLYLSYCNRLTDAALKTLESMRNLVYVDLQGCLSITKGGLARVRRRTLEIYR
jgi:Leucine-rich repeat (LRR) protein